MASPGAVSSDTPRPWAPGATAMVATSATRPATRPVRHSVGVEAERSAGVVDGTAGVIVAVIGAPGVSGAARSNPHPVYERSRPDRHRARRILPSPATVSSYAWAAAMKLGASEPHP